jgi:hypothetical protein
MIETARQSWEKALRNLRYGRIVLTVHDGKVRQLEITERLRFSES